MSIYIIVVAAVLVCRSIHAQGKSYSRKLYGEGAQGRMPQ